MQKSVMEDLYSPDELVACVGRLQQNELST